MSLAPHVDPETARLELEWCKFYSNVLLQLSEHEHLLHLESPGLDKVVSFLERMANPSVYIQNLFTEDMMEPVNNLRLFDHYITLMRMYGIPEKQESREFWNFSHDLLRTLKQVKEGFYRPHIRYSDARVADDFISLIKSP